MYSKDEYKNLKTSFWTGFSDYCTTVPEISMRRPHFMLYDTKVKGVELKFDLRRDSVDVALEVNGWGRDEMFEKVLACRLLFENAFENFDKDTLANNITSLIYEPSFLRENGATVSRIYIRFSDIDFHRRNYWTDMYDFMAKAMLRMEEVLYDIRDSLSE